MLTALRQPDVGLAGAGAPRREGAPPQLVQVLPPRLEGEPHVIHALDGVFELALQTGVIGPGVHPACPRSTAAPVEPVVDTL
jgi:hypothetical protein